jgi:hypothetical protein
MLLFLAAIVFCTFQSYTISLYSEAQTASQPQQQIEQRLPVSIQPVKVKIVSHVTGQIVPTGENTNKIWLCYEFGDLLLF